MKAHGVPWLIRHLNGEITLEDAAQQAKRGTRLYTKRQATWFRNQLPQFVWAEPHDALASIEAQLRELAETDPLTGLYNRAYFELELDRLDRSRQFPVSVVMVDVDGLKKVNDTKGHAAGDQLLQQAAKVLSSVFRAEDMVARIGGDEFVVLLPGSDAAAVDNELQRIRLTIAENCISCNDDGVSLSLGAATATEAGGLLQAIKQADQRMYQDKLSRGCRDRQATLTALR